MSIYYSIHPHVVILLGLILQYSENFNIVQCTILL